MIGFALLFWLVVAFALAFVVFNVGSSRGGEEIPDILLLIAPVAGGVYGWDRSRRQRAAAEGRARWESARAERIAAFVEVAVLVFCVLGFGWLMLVGVTTDGWECSLEEVECAQPREVIASDAFAAVTLPLTGAAALAVAWHRVRRRPREYRGRLDGGGGTNDTGE